MKTRHARIIRQGVLEGRYAWNKRKGGAAEYRYRKRRMSLSDRAWLRGYHDAFTKNPPAPPKGSSGIYTPPPVKRIEIVINTKEKSE